MSNFYPTAVSSTQMPPRKHLLTALRFSLLLFSLLPLSVAASAAELVPYSAVYTSTQSGITADVTQTLRRQENNHWRLHNNASVLFVGFDEEAIFSVADCNITPLSYEYNNKLSSSRSSQLHFDWDKDVYIDKLHSKSPQPLKQNVWDKLSVQVQMRLDLMAQGDKFTQKRYPQVDRKKIKNYITTKLGEEEIHTDLGTFSTIKLEERREGRDRHTLIWLAKDWDYLLLRLQRIEDGDVNYQIDLKEAVLNGEKVTGKP